MRNLAFALVGGLLLAASGPVPSHPAQHPSSYASKIGVDLDGIGDGDRAQPFVDLAKTLRGWMKVNGDGAVPVDNNGWPLRDASTVLFDIRPFGAWLGPDKIDDPDRFQPDWSGAYHFSFHGQAEMKPRDISHFTLRGVRYDAKTNTTSGVLNIPRGTGLLVVSFVNTRRHPGAAVGSGITDLRIVRPDYPANTRQVFTTAFLKSLRPFSTLRFMDWLETNANPGYFGDTGHHALNWADCRPLNYATESNTPQFHGIAWKYVTMLANSAGKDIWINIPIAATDDYVRHLAAFLKKNLKPGLRIYIEHSNEVWNFGFPQYIYNKLAAIDEVKRGASPVNNDGSKDQEVWAHRRHAQRLVEISNIFRSTYGDGAMGRIIRPVYASWTIFPDAYYRDVLKWVQATYGPPSRLFYGVADAAYFGPGKVAKTGTPEEIMAAMRESSDSNVKFRDAIHKIAVGYGLKHCQYEVGPDTGGGDTTNVANRIRANRLPGMKDVILHDARENWFNRGGDIYMYFSHCSPYSRYGSWGLSEDIANLDTPKWRAIRTLTGGGR